MMNSIRPSDVSPQELQVILQTAIAPRPIALASTVDTGGDYNLSPFSFFNMFSTVPPILIFSPSRRVRDNTTKHTLENILEVPEVVIGTVNYSIVQQTSLASTEYDRGISEFDKAGFTMLDADLVRPKLIAECPVNFECSVNEVKSLGSEGGAGNLVICEVKKIHIRTEYLNESGQLDQGKLDLVARLGGNYYSRNNQSSLFTVPKPLARKGIGIDQLPAEIRFSKIFTGNDLGMLANVETLPEGPFSSGEKDQRRATECLAEGDIEGAWKILTQ